MIIDAVAATTNVFLHSGVMFGFTEDQLKLLAATAPGAPVTFEFNSGKPPIGKVISAFVKEEKLHVRFQVDFDNDDREHSYIVPAFRLPTFESIEYGITNNPADKTLPAINY